MDDLSGEIHYYRYRFCKPFHTIIGHLRRNLALWCVWQRETLSGNEFYFTECVVPKPNNEADEWIHDIFCTGSDTRDCVSIFFIILYMNSIAPIEYIYRLNADSKPSFKNAYPTLVLKNEGAFSLYLTGKNFPKVLDSKCRVNNYLVFPARIVTPNTMYCNIPENAFSSLRSDVDLTIQVSFHDDAYIRVQGIRLVRNPPTTSLFSETELVLNFLTFNEISRLWFCMCLPTYGPPLPTIMSYQPSFKPHKACTTTPFFTNVDLGDLHSVASFHLALFSSSHSITTHLIQDELMHTFTKIPVTVHYFPRIKIECTSGII